MPHGKLGPTRTTACPMAGSCAVLSRHSLPYPRKLLHFMIPRNGIGQRRDPGGRRRLAGPSCNLTLSSRPDVY